MHENKYWLYTDIDGDGKRWHLVEEVDDQIVFLSVADDFFHDYKENYQDCERAVLEVPCDQKGDTEAADEY